MKMNPAKTRVSKWTILAVCTVMLAAVGLFCAQPASAEEAPALLAEATETQSAALVDVCPFSASVGEVGALQPDAYTYTDWSDYTNPVQRTAGMYTLTVPAGTTQITLTFSEHMLAYGYEANDVYVSSGSSKQGGYENNGQVGETTAVFYADNQGKFVTYVQVQAPYNEYWFSEFKYAINIVFDSPSGGGETNPVDFATAYRNTGALVTNILVEKGYAYGTEWLVMGSARAGSIIPVDYYNNVVAQLKANNGQLHSGAGDYANYAKTILALTAAGFDATKVGGYDLTAWLADFDMVTKQGLNGATYALLALDCHDYDIPKCADGLTQTTREALVDYILNAELSVGGWAWSGTEADPDMTAISLQALAPYRDATIAEAALVANGGVQAAINRGVQKLSDLQNEDGSYTSWGSKNSCSAAQVVTALTALGINPDTDSRFVKENGTALDGLLMFAVEEGGFGFTSNELVDEVSTTQGYYALVAYDRMAKDETSLFDMTDVTEFRDVPSDPGKTPDPTILAATGDKPFALIAGISALVATAVAVAAMRRRSIEE